MMFKLLIACGVILALGLTWAAAPFLSIETMAARTILVFLLLAASAVIFALHRVWRWKKGRMLEESLQTDAREQVMRTRPDRKAEIQALRVQFEKAVSALKVSKS